MKVLDIKEISKEDGYIYYINRYRATAVLDILAHKVDIPLSFSIETNPFGVKTVEIDTLPDDLNYPVMPVKKSLKDFIIIMDKQGSLP